MRRPAPLDQLSPRERWTSDEDRVFVNDLGEHIEDSALCRRFYRALEAASLPHIRFHDLRHTFGTIAVQAFPLTDVKAFMGHADIQTTMIYIHHVRSTTPRTVSRSSSKSEFRVRAGARRVHGSPPRAMGRSRKPSSCRGFPMPEEGLEPPTRGL